MKMKWDEIKLLNRKSIAQDTEAKKDRMTQGFGHRRRKQAEDTNQYGNTLLYMQIVRYISAYRNCQLQRAFKLKPIAVKETNRQR